MKRQSAMGFLAVLVCLAFPAAVLAEVGTLADGDGLVAWGKNTDGQCDVPAGHYTAIAAGDDHGLAIRSDGSLAAWGRNDYGQCDVPAGTDYISVAGGAIYSLARKSDGSLVAWGNNDLGQCNVPPGVWTAIAAGRSHGLAANPDGSRSAWGWNYWGQCNMPAGTYTAVAAGDGHSLALKSDGSLSAWGNNSDGQCNVPAENDFTAIAAGQDHSLALASDGSLTAWGLNNYGQCNVPVGDYAAVSAAYGHSLALRPDGSLGAWGLNNAGQCDVPAGTFVAVAAGVAWDGINKHGYSLALEARTDYSGDLLVGGTGVQANLNRSVVVAGKADVKDCTMHLYNNPSMNVGGSLAVQNATIAGQGVIVAQGELALSGPVTFSGAMHLTAGALTGSGTLTLDGTRLTVAGGKAYSGDIHMQDAALAFTGSGAITAGSASLDSLSSVRVDFGQRLEINGSLENEGLVQALGTPALPAELNVRGLASNQSGSGMISARDARLTFSTLENEGAIALVGGTNDITGKIYNSGGSITVTGGATAVFYDDVVQDGSLAVQKIGSTASVAILLGALSGSGGITGGGDVFIEGDLRPGNSAAAVTYDCNLFLGSAARIVMELAGTTLGTEYDHITVTGELAAGGTLELVLLDNFDPTLGQSFDLFYAPITGSFDSVTLPELATGLAWDTSGLYSVGVISVVPEPATLALLGLGGLGLVLRRKRK